ncbi:MAG: S1C family serine protease [Thermomicrobiales bacterium]
MPTWPRFPLVVLTTGLLVLAGCTVENDDNSEDDGAGVVLEEAAPTVVDQRQAPPPTTISLPLVTPTLVPIAGSPDIAAAQPTGVVESADVGAAVPAPMSPVEVVQRVRPAVVTVLNERVIGGIGASQAQEAGRGTGFIIDESGYIVTNEHVVRRGDQFEVIFANGEKRSAELVGADRRSDLAVVRVEGDVPATVPLGDSDALQVAQPVLAIGSPLGEFTNTVTDGIVSSLERDFPQPDGQGEPAYSNLIQHNAAINPGNSGGPLFDLAGQVIGVNTLGIPQTSQGIPAQGLFFAIPSNTVKRITEQLITQGQVVYPFLGVSARNITPELAAVNDLPVDYGVYVEEVIAETAAERSGLQPGDIVLEIGGHRLDATTSLSEALSNFRPNDTVPVTLLRGNEELAIDVTLGERPPE